MDREKMFLTASRPNFDPVVVGQRARAYQDSERLAGREISTTAAVAYVMQAGSPAKRSDRVPARAKVDYGLEVRLQSELIRRDRARHGY